jgi:transposase, IS5 family
MRDSSRSVGWRLREIARAPRDKAPPSQDKMKRAYGKLLQATGRVVVLSKRFSKEIGNGVKRCIEPVQQIILKGQQGVIDEMLPLVQQVIRQTKARVFDGESRSEGKIVSQLV